ncbi:PREDICTED: uncharacterized protein LOC108972879 [Bactrocera latifrons]|uniref:uncharacterized protein LOC108972879 n=1 Tax=Bactrocera latifrons TaxID=174628 RepID=UPI0008DDF0BC|nr:PREDICTED: uncharacterized protein LOC108972879 [Bactrocera latifrons]
MDPEQILALLVDGLKENLERLGLVASGRKTVLQDRLLEHFGLNTSEDEADDAGSRRSVNTPIVERSMFTLRDVEDSMTPFNSSGQPNFEQGLQDFEDNAEAVQWNELQKYIYAKQLLKGAAKMFVRGQVGICSYSSLKSALKSEFGTTVSAIDVHRTLRNRRKRQNEDMREYLYCLMETGKPINLDDHSLIEYFVDGTPDSKVNKSNLYQARSIGDLKEQIKIYNLL